MILNNEFQEIHDSYDQLNYDTLIPCNCAPCKASSKPYSYPLDRLRQFIDQRRPTIQCYESSEDVNVRRLLDDTIESDRDRQMHGMGDPEVIQGYGRGYKDIVDIAKRMASRPIINHTEATAMTDQSSKTNNFNAPMSGVIGSDNAQVSNNQFTQINNADTAELLQIIATLRQTVAQFPQEIQDDIIIDIDDIETEIKKPEDQRNPGRLKKRLLALAAAGSMIATPIVGMTDYASKVVDLAEKVGIEIQIPPSPPAP